MNEDFSSLWRTQEVVEHDNEQLKAMWRRRCFKDRLSYAIALAVTPFAIWIGVDTGISDVHWSKKLWVIFWTIFCCTYSFSMLWFLRNNVMSLAKTSSSALMKRMRKSVEFRLKTCRILKPTAILMVVMLFVFNLVYFSSNTNAEAEWSGYLLKNAIIVGVALFIWFYCTKKIYTFKQELLWLKEFEK